MTQMPRYILIDNHSGYIWGDSADLNGAIFDGTPLEFAAALDASLHQPSDTYEEVSHRALASDESGYHVYRADGGSHAVPVVYNGQDRETIEAVERDCEFVTTIRPVRL